jgi:GH25 family lysozyme M1 (1,4-beta-N-acetylmuramidase)
MSLTGIDVSSYQGTINWWAVKQNGIDFAILKVIRKDLNPDKKFEENCKNCEAYGMKVQGVYNYSYATTVAKARSDAKRVLAILGNRKPMVWMDVEDAVMKNLGKNLISIINAYGKVITDAGLQFGVYTGESFYKTYIKPYGGVSYPMWIARYGKNNGKCNVKYQPQVPNMVGWQYTSKGRVGGIVGNVDMNVWYKELDAVYEDSTSYRNPYTEPERLLYYKRLAMMKGNDVKWVQYELVRKGFMPSVNAKGKTNIDGYFGKTTSDAVKAFQKSIGITVDGKVGAVTWAYLKK